MPKKTGYKEIKCKTCGKLIARFRRSAYPSGHVPKEKILSATRKHYKEKHPRKFKESVKKGVETRMGKGKKKKKRKRKPKEKWGKIGAPNSDKRKKWMKKMRNKR